MLMEKCKVDIWKLEKTLKHAGFNPAAVEYITRSVEAHTPLLAASKEALACGDLPLGVFNELERSILLAEGR